MAQCVEVAKVYSMWDLAFWGCQDKTDFENFGLSVWDVWNLRNKWTHGDQYTVVGDELTGISSFQEDFLKCQATAALPQPSHLAATTKMAASFKWKAPNIGEFRLDVDASFSSVDNL